MLVDVVGAHACERVQRGETTKVVLGSDAFSLVCVVRPVEVVVVAGDDHGLSFRDVVQRVCHRLVALLSAFAAPARLQSIHG